MIITLLQAAIGGCLTILDGLQLEWLGVQAGIREGLVARAVSDSGAVA